MRVRSGNDLCGFRLFASVFTGRSLWRTIFASGHGAGPLGSGDCAPLAVAKRVCRAGDWLDSTRMSRPCGGDGRAASAEDFVAVHRVLPRGADTFITRQGRARAAECAVAKPGNGPRTVTRRWA